MVPTERIRSGIIILFTQSVTTVGESSAFCSVVDFGMNFVADEMSVFLSIFLRIPKKPDQRNFECFGFLLPHENLPSFQQNSRFLSPFWLNK
jgi:hypothetical protein